MAWSRRLILASAALLPAIGASSPGLAATAHYPMACDPALTTALRAASDAYQHQTDIFIHILPTSPSLQVPQMTHQIQNDIVMARADIVAGVDAAGYAVPGAPRQMFRGRMVLATRTDAPAEAIRTGPFAVIDQTSDNERDDTTILAAMGLHVAHPVGAIDSGGVAFLVASGAAGAGLMLLSDVRQNAALKVVMEVPESAAPVITYIVSTTRAPRRPEPEGFVTFLGSPKGTAIMFRHGLEKIA